MQKNTKCAECSAEESDKKHMVCSRCKLVYYCSKEHQVAHWKSKHKTECLVQNVKNTQNTQNTQNATTSTTDKLALFKSTLSKLLINKLEGNIYIYAAHYTCDITVNFEESLFAFTDTMSGECLLLSKRDKRGNLYLTGDNPYKQHFVFITQNASNVSQNTPNTTNQKINVTLKFTDTEITDSLTVVKDLSVIKNKYAKPPSDYFCSLVY